MPSGCQLRIAEDITDYDALLTEFVGTPIKHSPSGRSVNFEAAAGGHDDLVASCLYGLVAADWLLGRPMMARLLGNFPVPQARRPGRPVPSAAAWT